jgi:hypothetical protein
LSVVFYLGKAKGFPELMFYGLCRKIECLVLELLGPNLEDLLNHCGGKFSLKTIIMIAFQVIETHNQRLFVCSININI